MQKFPQFILFWGSWESPPTLNISALIKTYWSNVFRTYRCFPQSWSWISSPPISSSPNVMHFLKTFYNGHITLCHHLPPLGISTILRQPWTYDSSQLFVRGVEEPLSLLSKNMDRPRVGFLPLQSPLWD